MMIFLQCTCKLEVPCLIKLHGVHFNQLKHTNLNFQNWWWFTGNTDWRFSKDMNSARNILFYIFNGGILEEEGGLLESNVNVEPWIHVKTWGFSKQAVQKYLFLVKFSDLVFTKDNYYLTKDNYFHNYENVYCFFRSISKCFGKL